MRKKSPAKSLKNLKSEIAAIRAFVKEANEGDMSDDSQAYCHDFTVVWTYRVFERFVLDVLVAQINRDPAPFYEHIGVSFDQHPTVDQCRYLLTGDRFFDFRGHSGLITVIKKAAGDRSPLEAAAKEKDGRVAFEILVGLRNYVAHESDQSWDAALNAMRNWEPDRQNLGSAGYWLSVKIGGVTRLDRLLSDIETLSEKMANAV